MKEISGQLIKSGRFKEAIPIFYQEMDLALTARVTAPAEIMDLSEEFSHILLNPSSFGDVEVLGNKMLYFATRIPGYVPTVPLKEFSLELKDIYDPTKINN